MYDVTKHRTKIILSYLDSTSRPAVTTNKNSFSNSVAQFMSAQGNFFAANNNRFLTWKVPIS